MNSEKDFINFEELILHLTQNTWQALRKIVRKKTVLNLIRHAKASAPNFYYPEIIYNPALDQQGREQALLAGQKLKQENILEDILLTSPSRRTQETAEIISRELNIAKRFVFNLNSCGFDRRWSESKVKKIFIAKNPGQKMTEYFIDDLSFAYSFLSLTFAALVNDILRLYQGRNIGLVTHAEVIDALVGLFDQNPQSKQEFILYQNCSLTTIVIDFNSEKKIFSKVVTKNYPLS